MDRIRFSLIAIGVAFIAIGAVLLYATAGFGPWFALGVLTAGALVLAGIAFSSVAGRWLSHPPSPPLAVTIGHDGTLGSPPATRGR